MYSLSVRIVQSPSCVWLFAAPWTAARQASLSFSISLSLLKLMSVELVMPSNHLILCYPFPLLPSGFPSIRWPKYWSLASGSVLPINIWDWLVWSSHSPRDSQESASSPQFKSINSLVLSLLYCPTLTSTHDYWKNHSFHSMGLYQESDASDF